ncbi:MAG: NAD(P)/FAD-dependent oxidoreductase, partial [Candidatus Nezhaarchaeales archaeon]
VLVLEEHGEIGKPVHCAGLVSISGLRALGVSDSFVLNRVRGARFYSPSGLSFKLHRGLEEAYVIDRASFDDHLRRLAEDAGSLIALKSKASSLLFEAGRVVGVRYVAQNRSLEVRASVVINAEGARFKIAREAGFTPPKLLLPAAQVEVEGGSFDEDYVELYFGRNWAPGFFAWIVPLKGGARVGLASTFKEPFKLLKRFRLKHPIASRKLVGCKDLKLMGGQLVLSTPYSRKPKVGLLTVGDAAGQVKPLTGGGIVLGGLCARVAGKAAAQAVFQGVDPNTYEDAWRRLIGAELKWAYLLRRLLLKLSDEAYDDLFLLMAKLEAGELLKEADMDLHVWSFKKAASKLGLSKVLPYALTLLITLSRKGFIRAFSKS